MAKSPSSKSQGSDADTDQSNSKAISRKWLFTTVIAVITVIFDLGMLTAGVFHRIPLSLSIIGIGIGTFFGMLAAAKYQSIGSGSEKDKGHMRTALTGMLICVYVSIVVLILTGDLNANNIIDQTNSSLENNLVTVKNANTTAIAISQGENNQNKIIDNFTNVIMVIIGFYFGSKAFTEVISKIKGGENSGAKSNTDESSDDSDFDSIMKKQHLLDLMTKINLGYEHVNVIKDSLRDDLEKYASKNVKGKSSQPS